MPSAVAAYIVAALLFISLCSSSSSTAVLAMVVNPVSPHPPGPTPTVTTSRRSLLTRMPLVVMGVTTSLSIGMTAPVLTDISFWNHCDDMNCQCSKCQQQYNHDLGNKNKYQAMLLNRNYNNNWVVNAYERRDVGDETSSGETKAMNDQAYETNNRLERDGLVLEVCRNMFLDICYIHSQNSHIFSLLLCFFFKNLLYLYVIFRQRQNNRQS